MFRLPRSSAGAALTVLVTLSACGDGAPAATAAEPVVRDSAGITIVENQAPAWREGEAWRVSAEPVLEIGMVEGPEPYQFVRIADAFLLPDSEIVVADAGASEIRWFDAEGRHIRTVGGEGGGPGEFQRLWGIRIGPDAEVWAWDDRARRLVRFSRLGDHLGDWTVDDATQLTGLFPDRTVLMRGGISRREELEAGRQRRFHTHFRFDPGTAEVFPVVELAGSEFYTWQDGRAFGATRIPFSASGSAAVREGRVWVAVSDRPEAVRLNATGDTLTIVRFDLPERPITDEDVADNRERRIASMRQAGARPQTLERMIAIEEDVPVPALHPFFGRLEVSRSGHLWFSRVRSFGISPDRWEVFDPDLRWLGTVHTPPGLRILEIGEEFILGIHRDDFDVQYLRKHTIDQGDP